MAGRGYQTTQAFHELMGHRRGRIWFRWFLAESLPARPQAHVVKLSELA